MLEWFNSLEPVVQAALITAIASVLGAIIAGIFGLLKKDKKTTDGMTINQKQGIANKGTQIGIQNNYNSNNAVDNNNKKEIK